MILDEILIDERATIRDALERLNLVSCRVIYVVRGRVLLASISDGDIRRFILRDDNMEQPVSMVANYHPKCFFIFQKQLIRDYLNLPEAYSAPIINYNKEVVAVAFRNGKTVRRECCLSCPVVMMAGGKGSRLYPYTKILPKALIPIGENPISELIFQRFLEYGCKDYYMIVNYKKNMIQAYFDSIDKGYTINYVEEEDPLGTGGGLYLLKGKIKNDFFLINCDIIIDADYTEIYDYHQKSKNFITIVGARYRHTVPYGVIDCDKEGVYHGIAEKPSVEYVICTGMYVVNSELIEVMPENRNISFPDLIEESRNMGKKIGVYIVDESAYMDMGQMEELEKMRQKLDLQ